MSLHTARDPNSFEFNNEERRIIDERINERKKELTSMDINLQTDTVRLSGQNYALISLVCPEGTNQKSEYMCLKIKGVFDCLESAKKHARRLQETENTFDIFVVSLYEWLLLPPNTQEIEDQVHLDEQLNTMLSEFKINKEKMNIEFDLRKEALKQSPDVNKLFNEEDVNLKRYISTEEEKTDGVEESKNSL